VLGYETAAATAGPSILWPTALRSAARVVTSRRRRERGTRRCAAARLAARCIHCMPHSVCESPMPSRRLHESAALVAYDESMFGRTTILVRQYSPPGQLDGVAVRLARRLSWARVRRVRVWHLPCLLLLTASPQRHGAQIAERAGEFHGTIRTSPARFSGLASVSVSR
jgi:hypothetical protein